MALERQKVFRNLQRYLDVVKEFLEAQLRVCPAEIRELEARYGVRSVSELEGKIHEGVVAEHSAWEDLIVLENLRDRAKKISRELRALRS